MTTVRRSRTALSIAMSFLALFLFSQALFAATINTNAHPVARITKPVNDGKRVVLPGHVPRVIANASITGKAIDMGRIDPSTPLQGMRIVLQSSPEQARELRRVLDEQQDKRTGNFHQWVTPEEFGSSFGVHDDDIQQVTKWLTKHGFTVDNVTKSKRVIQFSGTSGQVEEAFQTSIHSYQVKGETHVSASTDISVPEALAPVISGVDGLHNFFRKSHMVGEQKLSDLQNNLKLGGPYYTSSSSVHYVGPADFATIYNTTPLLAAGINGTGQTIAIVGRSDILMSDVQTYRQMFNLPVNDPIFIHAGQDNGVNGGDDGESDLDVEISGGVAPNATVKFVIGTPTFLVDGITNSIEYIVENNLADIMSISYGSCEEVEGAGGNAFNLQAFEQAAAQGISVFVAAGDGGPAGCDLQGSQTYEVLGYAVGAEAGTPYSVSVGGTEFYGDGGAGYSTYWSPTNNTTYLSSALTYIPEYPWNESRVASPLPTGDSGSDLWSGSGGISAYYLRPSWQQGSGINNSTDPTLTLGNGATGLWVSSVTITNPGSGYTTAPTVAFSGGGCTAEPAATSTISGGQVTGLAFTGYTSHFEGFGCTSAPTIAFSGGGGTGAAATATVGPMQYPPPLISGVPHRLQPDLALNAASGHDATFFCSEGVCEISSTGALEDAGLVGGTSVAAPSMAGIQALINQANGGRQGMPGYIYYTLAAAQNDTNCNSSGPPGVGSNCAFQDVTLGNNLICGLSGGSCTAALTQAKIGFNAGTGYDMASGLGSPNAANLSSQWSSVVFNSSSTTLNLSQTSGINHGTAITLSGAVSGNAGTPTGNVAFIASQGAIGWVVNPSTGAPAGDVPVTTLSGGSFSTMLNNLPAGTYNVQARYGGDSTFASSISAPVQVTVNSEGSGLTITPYSLNGTACVITPTSTFSYASNILILLNVAGNSGAGAPTGTVTINLDGNPLGTYALDSNGNASVLSGPQSSSTSCLYGYEASNVANIVAGGHTLTASYSGDGTFNATNATPVPITVNPITPTITLSAGATQITSGFSDPLVATLGVTTLTGQAPASAAPTGTVTFYDTTTSTSLGSAPVVTTSQTITGTGITTYTATAALSATGITTTGANAITATYNGDTNFNSVTSSAVTVTVGTGTATTTTVTSSGNPTTLNGRPTFTATIAGGAGPTAGTVTFYDGTTVLGTGTVGSGHTATFRPASGQAFFGGAHNITATFGGNGTFMASTSAVFVENVTLGTVTHALSAKTAGNAGQAYYFTDIITPSNTNATFQPTGTVTFHDGATPVGTASLTIIAAANGGYALYNANVAVTSLAPGTHTITATFNGDVNYSASTSSGTSGTQTVYVGNGSPTNSQGIYSPLSPSALAGTSVTFRWFPIQQLHVAVGVEPIKEGQSPRTSEAAQQALTGAKRRYGARTSVRALSLWLASFAASRRGAIQSVRMVTCSGCGALCSENARLCPSCGRAIFVPDTPTLEPSGNAAGVVRLPVGSHPPQSGGFSPGTVLIERYRIVALLGRGGMGEVYRAEDLKLSNVVALKFLPASLQNDAAALAGFHAEVRNARQVSHPNVCRVYDIGEVNGQHFLTMEYIDGEDLSSLLRRIGRLPPDKALEAAHQICAGLAAAHDCGLLHRDLKPANIMLDGRGRVRITDFGLALSSDDATGRSETAGTPAYMAPEQIAKGEASVRSDIYSLGLVFYELFTGHLPYQANTAIEWRRAHVESSPRTPSSVVKDIDPAVESAILRCLQKDPSKRPSSVRQVAAAFPGGDPLAAALAAGETPSPEMVAASGETEGLRPVVAWTLLAGVVVSVIAAILLSAQTKLYRRVPLEKPPDALAEHARDILQSVGYSEPPVDTAMGVYEGNEFLRYIEEHDRSKTRWDNLDTGAFVFWYRGSPRPLDSHSSSPDEPMVAGSVWTDDPPLDVSGMTLVRLNPRGHLTQFIAVPPQVEKPAGAASSPDWAPLFSAAGLDPSKWPPTQPLWTPPVYSDARAAWIGSLAECPNIRNMAATKQPRIQSSPLNRN